MAFFQRVMNYLLNEVLVNTLANSPTFQRFAIRSNAKLNEISKKAAETQTKLNSEEVITKSNEIFNKSGEFLSAFREEMFKGMKGGGRY